MDRYLIQRLDNRPDIEDVASWVDLCVIDATHIGAAWDRFRERFPNRQGRFRVTDVDPSYAFAEYTIEPKTELEVHTVDRDELWLPETLHDPEDDDGDPDMEKEKSGDPIP